MINPWRRIRELDAEVQRLRTEVDESNDVLGEQAIELQHERLEHATTRADLARAEGRTEVLAKSLASAQRAEATLLAQLLELKREGFQSTAPAPVTTGVPARTLPSGVMAALNERAQPGSPLWNDEYTLAIAQLEADTPEDRIIADIRKGGDFDPWR